MNKIFTDLNENFIKSLMNKNSNPPLFLAVPSPVIVGKKLILKNYL